MNDDAVKQSQKLSVEEELDVLEAVYKVGKEKGLNLMQPQQLKRLTDAGRIVDGEAAMAPEDAQEEELDQKLVLESFQIVDDLVTNTEKYKSKFYTDQEWNGFNDDGKYEAMKKMFVSLAKITPEDLGYSIYGQLHRMTYGS